MSDNEKAIEYGKVGDAYADDGDAYATARKYARAMDTYAKAIEAYTKAIDLDQKLAGVHYNRGIIYANQGELNKAIKDYTKEIDLNPTYVQAYYNRGNAYYDDGDYDKAIDDYTKVIESKSDCDMPYVDVAVYVEAYINRGYIYHKKECYDKAIDDYDMAIKINENYTVCENDEGRKIKKNYAFAYNNKGYAYEKKGDYASAIDDYNLAIAKNPDHAGAYHNLGTVHMYMNNLEEAVKNHKKSFDLEVKNNKNLSSFIFHYIGVLNNDILIKDEKFNIEYLKNELVKNAKFWENEIYMNNDNIKKLSIYEHILLYFLTLKDEDAIDEVASYTSTTVLNLLIKKDKDKSISKIRMSALANANDTVEGTALFEILNKYTEKNIKEDEDTKKENCTVQTSFTRCIDSLTMFRLYGKTGNKEGSGVSLVLNKKFFDTAFEYNQLPTTHIESIFSPEIGNPQKKIILNDKQPLYYVMYYDKETCELVFNPHKSKYKNIIINLSKLTSYKSFKYPKGLSFVTINKNDPSKDNYRKVEYNIGYLLNRISTIINELKNEDIQKGYKALGNIKYLIKNSSWVEEQELRILKILKYDNCATDDERKSAYKNYFDVVRYSALDRIILGPKITNVDSVAEKWREYIKKQSENDKRYKDIEVSISKDEGKFK